MGNANETYSAIFDLFTYWGYSMEAEPGKTLGEILQEALDTGNSSEIYYQTLNDAIKRYPSLQMQNLRVPAGSRADGIIQKLTLASLNYQMEIIILHTGVQMMVDGLIMDRA